MPSLPLRPCTVCGRLAKTGSRCERHPRLDQRPSASQRGYGKPWEALRATIPRPALCQKCNAEPTHTLDHKLPRSLGGSDDPSNLWWLGKNCNHVKLASTDGGFGNPVSAVASTPQRLTRSG